jgi:hypothetical protein
VLALQKNDRGHKDFTFLRFPDVPIVHSARLISSFKKIETCIWLLISAWPNKTLNIAVNMAATIRGSDFPPQSVADKCASAYKSLVNKKKISMDATGDQKNNALVIFLQCQVKTGSKNCKDAEKEYSLCHKSFMGMGSYKGKRNCGDELRSLYQCVLQEGAKTL